MIGTNNINFFKNQPVDFSHDEAHSQRFSKIFKHIYAGDTIALQGPVWFIPFIREFAQELKEQGVKQVYFEHQLIFD